MPIRKNNKPLLALVAAAPTLTEAQIRDALKLITEEETAKLIGLISHLVYWNVFGHLNQMPLDKYHTKQLFISIVQILQMYENKFPSKRLFVSFIMPMIVLAIRIEVELIYKNSYKIFFSKDQHCQIAMKLVNDVITQLVDPNLYFSRFSFFESGREAINIKYEKSKHQHNVNKKFYTRSALIQQLIPNPSEGEVRAKFGTGRAGIQSFHNYKKKKALAQSEQKMQPYVNRPQVIRATGSNSKLQNSYGTNANKSGEVHMSKDLSETLAMEPYPHQGELQFQIEDSNPQNNIFYRIREARKTEEEEEVLLGDNHSASFERLRDIVQTDSPDKFIPKFMHEQVSSQTKRSRSYFQKPKFQTKQEELRSNQSFTHKKPPFLIQSANNNLNDLAQIRTKLASQQMQTRPRIQARTVYKQAIMANDRHRNNQLVQLKY